MRGPISIWGVSFLFKSQDLFESGEKKSLHPLHVTGSENRAKKGLHFLHAKDFKMEL